MKLIITLISLLSWVRPRYSQKGEFFEDSQLQFVQEFLLDSGPYKHPLPPPPPIPHYRKNPITMMADPRNIKNDAIITTIPRRGLTILTQTPTTREVAHSMTTEWLMLTTVV